MLLIMKQLFVFLFAILMLSEVSPLKAEDYETATACIKCHQKAYEQSVMSPYRHLHADRECANCHIYTKPAININIASTSYQNNVILKINALPKKGGRVVAKAKDSAEQQSQPINTLIDISSIAVEGSDGVPPKIFDIKVTEVSRGTLASAAITWKTNLPTYSGVKYGLTDKYGERQLDDLFQLTEIHRVSLRGLKPNSVYHYQIQAEDVFHNKVLSEGFTLDTGKPFKLQEIASTDDSSQPEIGSLRFFRIKDDQNTYVNILTTKPSIVLLNLREDIDPTSHGYGLLPKSRTTIDICVECHKRGSSHRVRIKVRPELKASLELPTIEDGLITCVTCHEPHGSIHSNLLRFESSEKKSLLCIKCHSKDRGQT